ncbi:MAG: PqqD family protein [Actinomycetota bacterium]|nr:PqqD family protein [Actinomycetota bacterium]
MIKMSDCPLRGMDSASCVINNQTLIVQSSNKKLYILNGAGTKIWELADGKHAIADIIARLKCESRKPDVQIHSEMQAFIEELVSRGVLVLLKKSLDIAA